MPSQPTRFQFDQELPSAKLEATARRRLRSLESMYPAVRGWAIEVTANKAAPGGGASPIRARVAASIVGGDTLEGHASSTDGLAALRLAFNALQVELEAETNRARSRAVEWLGRVRMRSSQQGA